MTSSFLRFAWLGLVGLSLLAGTSAHADPVRVAVVPALTLDASTKATLEADARAALVKAVDNQGVEPVLLTNASADKLACNQSDCLRALARETGTSYVLRVQASYRRESYELRAELWNAATGKLIETRDRECEVCTGNDLVKAIRESASVLCARLSAEPAAAPAAVAQPVPPAALPPAQPANPREDSYRGWRIGGGAVLAAAGAGLAGWGIWQLSRDGKGYCSSKSKGDDGQCPMVKDNAAPGWTNLGVGLGLVALGAVVAVPVWLHADTSVAVGPSGVQVTRTF